MRELKTTVLIKLSIDACHNFPLAADLFPEVDFLADRHRHMFHFTLAKMVNNDDRDVEFIMFKRDVLNYLHDQYSDSHSRTHEFGAKSCEMLSRELLERFECDWVECWEDQENGARIERI